MLQSQTAGRWTLMATAVACCSPAALAQTVRGTATERSAVISVLRCFYWIPKPSVDRRDRQHDHRDQVGGERMGDAL